MIRMQKLLKDLFSWPFKILIFSIFYFFLGIAGILEERQDRKRKNQESQRSVVLN